MSTRSSSLIYPSDAVGDALSGSRHEKAKAGDVRSLDRMKCLYQTDQQMKYLHLQAEIELLLQHLQTMKQQRMAMVPPEAEAQ